MYNLKENLPNNSNTSKEYINKVLNQLLIDYKNTREERRELANWEEFKDFSIIGEIEIFTDSIRGYASQLITDSTTKNAQESIEKLKQIQIFNISEFVEWYFRYDTEYPQLKNYIEKLNYLRLLIIEYISQYQLII
jgi:hypothetical protein